MVKTLLVLTGVVVPGLIHVMVLTVTLAVPVSFFVSVRLFWTVFVVFIFFEVFSWRWNIVFTGLFVPDCRDITWIRLVLRFVHDIWDIEFRVVIVVRVRVRCVLFDMDFRLLRFGALVIWQVLDFFWRPTGIIRFIITAIQITVWWVFPVFCANSMIDFPFLKCRRLQLIFYFVSIFPFRCLRYLRLLPLLFFHHLSLRHLVVPNWEGRCTPLLQMSIEWAWRPLLLVLEPHDLVFVVHFM